MRMLRWVIVAVLALLVGISLVRFLTVDPIRMSLYLFFTCLFLFVTIALVGLAFSGKELWGAIPLAILLFVAGYALMTWRVLSREDSRPLPAITRAKGDRGDGHTAIVYLTHGEPETYDPIGWLNTFREIDETGVSFVPKLARPMFLMQLRRAYLRVGSSQHVRVHRQMGQSLEKAFRDAGDATTKVYVSFLDADPRPDAAAIQALNEGASEIIVMLVFVSVSNHTAEGKEMIEELGVEDYGATLKFAGPLWDSRTLQGMFLQRANAVLGDDVDKSKVGVVLVGHGQPDEWDREFPTETEHEISFRMEALKLFEQDGYRPENLSLAWMEFKKPHPAEKIEEFAKNGVNTVVYFAAAISADSIHSQHDIPELVHEARVPAGFVSINLGAWNDDPIVIRAIKEKIDEQMR